MISSGAFPKVTFSRPPIPGPDRAASSSVALPISEAVGMTPSAEVMNTSVDPAPANESAAAIGMNGRSTALQPNAARIPRAGDWWEGVLTRGA